ncbi:MAG: AGE family epimerase/isomerase [Oscillospiraceae bacterium]|jgi:mannobiose 2-epimerase|nr:AGE family epimerase/isomerase [Oscillospiraceae bacterium]
MKRLSLIAKIHLEKTILPFWMNLRDDARGGYYGYMSQDLVLDKKAEKGCILNSRILWFFSEAAMALRRIDLLAYANHAYEFMRDHCIDRDNGGVFWSMNYDGTPLDVTKHTYNQAFAIYALSSYYRLTGDTAALSQAEELFRIIEARCTDSAGYLESFTVDWQPESNEKLSENGILADKTMNTLLHVFEGYSGLFQATKDDTVGKAMKRILTIYTSKIYDSTQHRQRVFFDNNYNSIIDLYSYGHDIESSWLMDWGCALLNDDNLGSQISSVNLEMAKAVFETAYRFNSLANECDRGKVDERRIWWVQAEAVVGLVHLWRKQPEHLCYRDAAANTFRFILDHLADKRPGGEWFWAVDQYGVPVPDKPVVDLWKCPYHNGRMCMELISRDPEIFI